MKLSLKVRYGIAAMVYLGKIYHTNEYIPLQTIADRLNISKIYLEQVFPHIKKAKLVTALKGAKGGYRLSRPPEAISLYEIVYPIETILFDETEETFKKSAPTLEDALSNMIYQPLNQTLTDFFKSRSVADLADSINDFTDPDGYMYYI